jgi:uncharacterized membrane protein YkoI
MKKNRLVGLTIGTLTASALAATVLPITFAAMGQSSTGTQPVSQQQTSNIQAPLKDAKETSDTEANGAPEAPVDPSLAKISAETARAAALQAQSGTVNKTELEDENGTIVYGFEIQNGDQTVDVKVDATTGKVIKVEQDNTQKDGEIDDAKQSQMKSQEKNEPAGQELKD